MRAISSIAATIALAACGTATPDASVDTDGLSLGGDTELNALLSPAADVYIVPVTGSLVNVGKDQPGDSIDWERDEDTAPDTETEEGDTEMEEGVGPQQPEAGELDRTFDPGGFCKAEPVERACPEPSLDESLSGVQARQLKAISDACEAWLAYGPSGYALSLNEIYIDDIAGDRSELEVTVCNGAPLEAFDAGDKSPLDPTTVDSIDSLYWAAADHVLNGDSIELEIDAKLMSIKRFTVQANTAEGHEFFEVTTDVRPILLDPAG